MKEDERQEVKWINDLKRTQDRYNAYFSSNVFASNQVITCRFFRSLYVGKMTEYLCVFAELCMPCISKETEDSNGFM